MSIHTSTSTNTDKVIAKYLARHACPEANALLPWLRGNITTICTEGVAIPSCAEGERLVATLRSIPASDTGSVLAVVFLNLPHDANADAIAAHALSRDAIAGAFPHISTLQRSADPTLSAALHRIPPGQLVVIDATLPAGQGVGLARKLVLDVLLAAWAARILSTRWLHTTDADAILPTAYWNGPTLAAPAAAVAMLHPFKHVAEPGYEEATWRYDLRLRHQLIGLHYAGSPYAHHSIGSTIAVDPLAYAEVRGVPRLLAGEDFYLLGKLRKLGPFVQRAGEPIDLAGRPSWRVPFGTGPALRRAMAGEMPRSTHPEAFVWLGRTWQAMQDAVRSCTALAVADAPSNVQTAITARLLADMCAEIAATNLPDHQRQRHLFDRMDAFATLKFLHALRDNGLPDVPAEQFASWASEACHHVGNNLDAQ